MEKSETSKNDRYVVRRGGDWAVKKPGADRASSVHGTQREAEQAAKNTVRNLGGGEVRIQGENGRWRDSDTVPPQATIRFRRATASTDQEKAARIAIELLEITK
ncbi:MAG: DUF2188 domain-containing protein [Xanthobacteraceae bacterium]